MTQFFIFALFLMVLLAGVFSYFTPHQNYPSIKMASETDVFDPQENTSSKSTQQASVTTSKGMMQTNEQTSQLVQKQEGVLAQASDSNDKDVLQLKALMAQFQDQGRILTPNGQDLTATNDQVVKNRKIIQDQMNLAALNNILMAQELKNREASLTDQSKIFLNAGVDARQKAEDQNELNKQRVADMMQRLKDQENR